MPLLTTLGSSSALSYGRTVQKLLTFVPASLAEGAVGTLTANNLNDGTYYWTILNNTSADADWAAVSGSFTVTDSVGTFDISPISDYTTEGTESFRVQVREGSTSGTVLLTSKLIYIFDASTTPSISRAAPAPNESGNNVNLTISNLKSGETYYWTIAGGLTGTPTTSADWVADNGSFTTIGTGQSLTLYPVADYLTEGNETYRFQLRTGSTSGTIIATLNDTLTDSSIDLAVTLVGGTTMSENSSKQINVGSVSPVPGDTLLYWTILNGTTTDADFLAVSGSFTVSGGAGLFTVRSVADGLGEPAETFQVQIRTGSTSGTVIYTSPAITINANAI